jgi:hypothetical protein
MGIGLPTNKTSVAVEVEGARATGTIQIIDNSFDAGDAVIINGVSFTEGTEWSAGGSVGASAINLNAAINASTDLRIEKVVEASVVTDTITIDAFYGGTDGNSITLAETDGATDNFTLSGATLSGGTLTEGTFTANTGGEKFIEIIGDNLEFAGTKENVDRNIVSPTVEQVAKRVGQKELSGSIGVEAKAGSTEGSLPEWDPIMRSLMGGRRRIVESVTTEAGNTASVLQIPTADLSKFTVGDIIKVNEAGAHFISGVKSIDSTLETITIEPAMPAAPADNVVISKATVYYHDDNAPTLSVSRYLNDGTNYILEKNIGLKSSGMSVENLSTGTIPQMTFSFEGLDFDQEVSSAPEAAVFDSSLPPIALNACLYVNGQVVHTNEFTLTVENEISFVTSTCSASGKLSSRVINFTVGGTFPAYKEDDDVDLYEIFRDNTDASVFIALANPDTVAGELKEGFGIYIPQCKFFESTIGDQNGIVTDGISFQSHRENGNDSLFIGVI